MVALPGPDTRSVFIGSTGSGKTQAAVWLLSTCDYNNRPWFIVDPKGEKLFIELEKKGAIEIAIDENELPTEPGIYIVRPLPGENELLTDFFKRIYYQENCGVFIDEATMMTKNDIWFRALLTQGRGKEIQLIICTQRPSWLDNYIFTEASFFALFRLNSLDDQKKMRIYLGGLTPDDLPRYHWLWYIVNDQRHVTFTPVPDASKIIAGFHIATAKGPTKL